MSSDRPVKLRHKYCGGGFDEKLEGLYQAEVGPKERQSLKVSCGSYVAHSLSSQMSINDITEGLEKRSEVKVM